MGTPVSRKLLKIYRGRRTKRRDAKYNNHKPSASVPALFQFFIISSVSSIMIFWYSYLIEVPPLQKHVLKMCQKSIKNVTKDKSLSKMYQKTVKNITLTKM